MRSPNCAPCTEFFNSLLGIVVVNPVGNFPHNDDFAYSRAVMHLLETGDFRPLAFAYMSLFAHVLWGTLFCLPAGFSFTALRLSTLVAGLIGLFGVYILTRDLRQPRWLALLTTMMLAFYPAYYLNSYTFMTDVPFAAAATWSAVFFARSLRSGSGFHALVATLIASVAMLSRQVALAIPLAFAATVLLTSRLTVRRLVHAIGPLIACSVVLVLYDQWLSATGRTPALYGSVLSATADRLKSDVSWLLINVASYCFYGSIYLGLFLLPIFLSCMRTLFWSDRMQQLWRSNCKATLALSVAAIALMASSAWFLAWIRWSLILPVPYGNALEKAGLGPRMLRDSSIMQFDAHVVLLPRAFWITITAAGILGALLLVAKLSVHAADIARKLWTRSIVEHEAVGTFVLICGFAYLLPFLIVGFYDRYLILVILFLAIGVITISGHLTESTPDRSRLLRPLAFGLVVAWGLISIVGTRDHLSWNRVRWQALNELMHEKHVGPEDIDGGSEFNGLYLYDPDYKPDPSLSPQNPNSRSPWWVHRDTYQVGFGAVPHYTVVKEYRYQHWMPPHVQKIVVMRKDD